MMKTDRLPIRLGVNIDHVATIRNARGGAHPDPLRAAEEAKRGGADGITAHLREDRRHIRDTDIVALRRWNGLPLNMEMAATAEMLTMALKIRPHACCLVPERRQELTTEGGLDVAPQQELLKPFIADLRAAGIRVSLFVDADSRQLRAAKDCGADIVELHTGNYAHNDSAALPQLREAAALAAEIGLECHAGHGLNLDNVEKIAAITQLAELNIGHFLVGEAIFAGMEASVRAMRARMDQARRRP